MYRLRCAILVVGIALLTVGSTSGQVKDKSDKDEPKAKGTLPANWKKLGLSDEQKEKIYKTQSGYKAKIDALQKQIADLKAEERDALLKMLTDDQKKRLRDIVTGETKDKDKAPEKDKKTDK